jgi:hypothetical protein
VAPISKAEANIKTTTVLVSMAIKITVVSKNSHIIHTITTTIIITQIEATIKMDTKRTNTTIIVTVTAIEAKEVTTRISARGGAAARDKVIGVGIKSHRRDSESHLIKTLTGIKNLGMMRLQCQRNNNYPILKNTGVNCTLKKKRMNLTAMLTSTVNILKSC